jgi:hypothetical protein
MIVQHNACRARQLQEGGGKPGMVEDERGGENRKTKSRVKDARKCPGYWILKQEIHLVTVKNIFVRYL